MSAGRIAGDDPRHSTLSELYRLIEALDRRVPHLERIGEEQIARDALALRERALELIRKIESGPSGA
jgi:hypothetical protein